MFVCICEGVTDSEVGDAVDAGANTVQAVGCLTGAGTGCGTCHDRIAQLLERHSDARHAQALLIA